MKRLKRFLSVGLSAILALACLCACGESANDFEFETDVRYVLVNYNTKIDTPVEDLTYFIFHEDGTGTYHYYYVSPYDSSMVHDYTVTFTYTSADPDNSAVALLGNKRTYAARHKTASGKNENAIFKELVTVSKNYLMSSNGDDFYNENFIAEVLGSENK